MTAVDSGVDESQRPTRPRITGCLGLRGADESGAVCQRRFRDGIELNISHVRQSGQDLQIGFVDLQRQKWNVAEAADLRRLCPQHSTEYGALRAPD